MRISSKSHQAARDVNKEADYSLKAQKKPEKIEIHHNFLLDDKILYKASSNLDLIRLKPSLS
ncbi:hypothetical protein COR52_10860 [Vibrio mediterranei]|uniref:Uncharacterized protein n=1 Tax=Vibrio mediterranei TaxID=689 RepID=A0ABX5D7A7_9VIBR|nr:hypothetical protein COR52_10860 [Vibrio mediterranei]PRQ65563.1 hypothetical protein COR51_21850 [Vibrio mediterranei]